MGRHSVAEVITGAFVLVIAIGFLAFAVSHSGRSVGSGYPLHASFAHIDGLNVGGDVRIGGVKVGTVTDEQLDPKTFEAVVSMSIQDGIELPKDTGAAVTSESLLGGKYVSLSPGGDTTNLKPGDAITVTQSAVSLEELLGKFIFSVTSLNSGKSDGSSGGGSPSAGQPNNQQNNQGGLPPLGK
ncbi:MAG TPA: outer membrane lipid asymmetry maintenance protein MlaD [Rhodopila sp.]|nr:outer membrane lipid asymmetry maintenance protein MlaD [Rhodopila sp.]